MVLSMTYNFDPDRWYETELAHLKARLEAGEMTEADFTARVNELDAQHEAMWQRLDGTYQIDPCTS
jgi:hypothetical protein